MKAILVRCKKTRKVLAGAVFLDRNAVVPFCNPALHQQFKNDDYKYYTMFDSNTLSDYKAEWSYDGTFFQEVISNG